MDAKKFLEEVRRMCKEYHYVIDCKGCPADDGSLCRLDYTPIETNNLVKMIEVVEKWSAEHPRKTRLMDFREKYPDAPLLEGFNIPRCYPVSLGYCDYAGCLYCPNKGKGTVWCWNQEVEEK